VAVSIVGDRPESGVRITLERPRDGGPPWAYEGTATIPEASFPLRVIVQEDGTVEVELGAAEDVGTAPPADLPERIRLLVRTAYRQAKTDDEAPARRIVRWRPGN
jgi:hypothetical protein